MLVEIEKRLDRRGRGFFSASFITDRSDRTRGFAPRTTATARGISTLIGMSVAAGSFAYSALSAWKASAAGARPDGRSTGSGEAPRSSDWHEIGQREAPESPAQREARLGELSAAPLGADYPVRPRRRARSRASHASRAAMQALPRSESGAMS